MDHPFQKGLGTAFKWKIDIYETSVCPNSFVNFVTDISFSSNDSGKKAATLLKADTDNFEDDDFLHKVNKDLVSLRDELNDRYAKASVLYQASANENDYRSLLKKLMYLKLKLLFLKINGALLLYQKQKEMTKAMLYGTRKKQR